MGTPEVRPFRMREAVVTETPDRWATSRSVVEADPLRRRASSTDLGLALGGIVRSSRRVVLL